MIEVIKSPNARFRKDSMDSLLGRPDEWCPLLTHVLKYIFVPLL